MFSVYLQYIAPPSNSSKSAQSPWNEGQSRITEMEWALRFNSYQSISNHIPPPFVGADVAQNIVETEVVGVSLDDVGFHGHEEGDMVNNTAEKGSDKSGRGSLRGRGSFRGRGRRGRGSWRGRGAASRGRGTSGGNQSDKGKNNVGGRGRGSNSPGSPQKSGAFSFFKRGRLGFSQTSTRGRGQANSKAPGRQGFTNASGTSQRAKRGRPFKISKRGRGVKTRSQS